MNREIRRTRGKPIPLAANDWRGLKPPPSAGRSYLIAADYGGIETFDVAFYNGLRRDGSHWWTLGNAEIDSQCIRYYAEINAPEQAKGHGPNRRLVELYRKGSEIQRKGICLPPPAALLGERG